MLKRLFIKNFAIINDVDLEFKPGLTIITGETGSGKSLLLKAISSAMGNKFDKIMIQSDFDRSIVEVQFGENDIRRILNKTGKVKSYFNDEPITLKKLKPITNDFIDFHGQNEQQKILNLKTHIEYLDKFSNVNDKIKELEIVFNNLNDKKNKLYKLRHDEDIIKAELIASELKLNEILEVNVLKDEDIILDKKLKEIESLEGILIFFNSLSSFLNDLDTSIISNLEIFKSKADKFSSSNNELNIISTYIESIILQSQDLDLEIQKQSLNINLDQKSINSIEKRLLEIENAKNKYGGSIKSILEVKLELESFLYKNNIFLKSRDSLEKDIVILEKKYIDSALYISNTRKKSAIQLKTKIQNLISHLNMEYARFEVLFKSENDENSFLNYKGQTLKVFKNGFDIVEFLLCSNPGGIMKPLVNVASGGEVSRIMLAIKSVFSDVDPVECLIFDEIDTGISGITAEKVGKQLKVLSSHKQIICITHLPQIATLASNHLHVSKIVENNSTKVNVEYLSKRKSQKIISDLTLIKG